MKRPSSWSPLSGLRRRCIGSSKLNRLRTWIRATIFPSEKSRFIFVFGCNRSGTTMLKDLIGLDPRVKDYGEGDPPYFVPERGPRYYCLQESGTLSRELSRERHPFTLVKPLHDSQRARELLAAFPEARGIWIFRDYRQVIQSYKGFFRNEDFRRRIGPLWDVSVDSWMNQSIPEDVASLLAEFPLPEIEDHNAYALYWLARNSVLFQQDLENELLILNYADCVRNPTQVLERISLHIGLSLPSRFGLIVHQESLRESFPFTVDSRIATRCEALQQRLTAAAAASSKG